MTAVLPMAIDGISTPIAVLVMTTILCEKTVLRPSKVQTMPITPPLYIILEDEV